MAEPAAPSYAFWGEGYRTLASLHSLVAEGALDGTLLELVRMRASQVNGCAFCIDMHAKDARAAGESEQRLYALSAWRETGFFSERERAALALTEAVTALVDHGAIASATEQVTACFGADERTQLLYAIIEINAWNRLAITTGLPAPGSYEPSR